MYIPLLMLSSLLISLVLVTLSFSPEGQIFAAFGVYLLWCLYSLCYCPYLFYIRVFIRIYELLFALQLVVLTIFIFKPEYSRMEPAIALLVFDFLQLINFIGVSLAIVLSNFYGVKCLSR